MAFTQTQEKRVDWILRKFVHKNRPPERVRHQVDLTYRIENQSVEILNLRTAPIDPPQTVREPIAKARYVKKSGIWKVYWQRADMKWHLYDPHPEAADLDEFLRVVVEDPNGCFWG